MNYKKHLCAALLALVPFTAFSQTTVNTPTAPAAAAADKSVPNAPAAIVQDEKQICDTLKKTLQGKLGIPVESVSVTPVKGVYEVVAQNEIMYSDATADHIIVGQLF
ncbi:disulfide isomerase DsbC N-terminal domain-containing protein, partial [Parasutterella excrementihominis]